MASTHAAAASLAAPDPHAGYKRFLLLVAGLGGLLYGVDVGIISGALPLPRSHLRLLRRPALRHRRRRPARFRHLHPLRRPAR